MINKYDYGYEIKKGSTYDRVLRYFTQGATVLEIGSAIGILCKYLTEEMHCVADIVEYDEEMGKQAARFARHANYGADKGDIEGDLWQEGLDEAGYDYIVVMDVLEHLRNPQRALERLKHYLKPDGRFVLSVPNLAHNSVLVSLFNDRFQYNSNGLLDNTHIHFFTIHSLHAMLAESGLKPIVQDCAQLRTEETEIGTNLDMIPREAAKALRTRPYGDVYQYFAVCRPDDGIPAEPFEPLPLETDIYHPNCYVMEKDDDGFQPEKLIVCRPSSLARPDLTVDFSAWKDAVKLRVDIMSACCVVRDFHASDDRGEAVRVIEHNACALRTGSDEYYFFGENNPVIILDVSGVSDCRLHISYEVAMFDDSAIPYFAEALGGVGTRIDENESAAHFTEADFERDMRRYHQKLMASKNHRIGEQEAKLRECTEKAKYMDDKLNAQQEALTEKQAEIGLLRSAAVEQQAEIERCQVLLQTQESEIERCQGLMQTQESEIERCQGLLQTQESEIERCQSLLQTRESEIERCQSLLQTQESEINQQKEELESRKAYADRQNRQLTAYADTVAQITRAKAAAEHERSVAVARAEHAEAVLTQIQNSRIWKSTALLRKLRARLRKH